MGAKEKLERIKKSEKEAECLLDQAHRDAEKTVERARIEGQRLVAESKRKSSDKAKGASEKDQAELEKEISKLRQKAEAERKKLAALGERNLDKAVKFVIERLV